MSKHQYNSLLRDHILRQSSTSPEPIRKRRRTKSPEENAVIVLSDTPEGSTDQERGKDISDNVSEDDSDDFEDVEFLDQVVDVNLESKAGSDEEESGVDYSYLTGLDGEVVPDKEEQLEITLKKDDIEQPSKRKVEYVSPEVRQERVLMHQAYILLMICHGIVRNKWCSQISSSLKRHVSLDIIDELVSIRRSKRTSMVNSVRFTDVVRHLMQEYSAKFRITKRGLIRKNWNELRIPQTNIERNLTFKKFSNTVLHFQGSRDVGAQGFLAMARSLGMKARLVFSLQPPDFTIVTKLPEINLGTPETSTKPAKKPVNSKQKFLNTALNTSSLKNQTTYQFLASDYPIFWVEIWNKYSRKWLAVDPVVLNLVENPPIRRKSSFEPPMSDSTNNLTYVVAFDSKGGVADVTRRYAQQYNARTVRKRISRKSEEYEDWYKSVLKAASTKTQLENSDILELKEFRDRDLAEGMPNSMSGFKDHPIYALELQLRQNQIIHPQDKTTQCGTFRLKQSAKSKTSKLIPVYKRSAVHTLRSAKAWYMRGRVLKVGQQPLKIKPAKQIDNGSDDDDGDDDSTRLYAEFQTKLYIPPAIVNGRITKNLYGNIDVYVPTMIPDGAYLFQASESRSIKLLEKAGRILDIDYAKAIVSFDFGRSDPRSFKGRATAREGGVVVASEYVEAMEMIIKQLQEDELEEKRKAIEQKALTSWKFFLTKLRISDRLSKAHGAIDDEAEKNTGDASDASSDYSVYSEDESSDGERYEAGGFLPTSIMETDVGEEDVENSVSATKDIEIGSTDALPLPGRGFVTADAIEVSSEDNFSDASLVGDGGGGFFYSETNDLGPETIEAKSNSSSRESSPTIVSLKNDDKKSDGINKPDLRRVNSELETGVVIPAQKTSHQPSDSERSGGEESNEIDTDDEIMQLPPEYFPTNDNGQVQFQPVANTNEDNGEKSAISYNLKKGAQKPSQSQSTESMPESNYEVSDDNEGYEFEYSDPESVN